MQSRCFDDYLNAKTYFEEVKKHHNYVCFLYSLHEYSKGYWVEFERPTNLSGIVINIHDIIDIRDDKIKEILDEKEENISI